MDKREEERKRGENSDKDTLVHVINTNTSADTREALLVSDKALPELLYKKVRVYELMSLWVLLKWRKEEGGREWLGVINGVRSRPLSLCKWGGIQLRGPPAQIETGKNMQSFCRCSKNRKRSRLSLLILFGLLQCKTKRMERRVDSTDGILLLAVRVLARKDQ